MKPCKDGSITVGDEQETQSKKMDKTKIATVNVLELIDGTPSQIVSFKDNPAGNKKAEKLFKQIAKEKDAPDEEMDLFLEDGAYTYAGTCGVYLIHSS